MSSNLSFVYIVDVDFEVEMNGRFTKSGETIKFFTGEKSLFKFATEVIESKHKAVVQRIVRITGYSHGGTLESFRLAFNDGNMELIHVGGTQLDKEVEVEIDPM